MTDWFREVRDGRCRICGEPAGTAGPRPRTYCVPCVNRLLFESLTPETDPNQIEMFDGERPS